MTNVYIGIKLQIQQHIHVARVSANKALSHCQAHSDCNDIATAHNTNKTCILLGIITSAAANYSFGFFEVRHLCCVAFLLHFDFNRKDKANIINKKPR